LIQKQVALFGRRRGTSVASDFRSASIQGGVADPRLDTSIPHSARVWNYWLGGKDNFAVDREVGEQVRAADPQIIEIARACRAFHGRAIRFLAGENGIRQFLDVGTGLPTANNTHEVAQRVDPRSRIVYVDNDPLVLVHARALLTSTREGATDYVEADAREPETILAKAEQTLDFSQPVGLILLGLMGNIADLEQAYEIRRRLVGALAVGSYLVLQDGVSGREDADEGARRRAEAGDPYYIRTPAELSAFFDGLDLVEPGVVSTPLWRPEPGTKPTALGTYCGVARKSR
jgi:hypothetical protein